MRRTPTHVLGAWAWQGLWSECCIEIAYAGTKVISRKERRGRGGNEQRKKLPTINVTPSNICACVLVCVCGTPLAASYQSVDAVTNWKCQANGQSDWQTDSVTHWLIEWIWDWMTGKRLAGKGNRRACVCVWVCSWGSKSKSAQTVMETTNTCAFSQQLPKNRNNCAE